MWNYGQTEHSDSWEINDIFPHLEGSGECMCPCVQLEGECVSGNDYDYRQRQEDVICEVLHSAQLSSEKYWYSITIFHKSYNGLASS